MADRAVDSRLRRLVADRAAGSCEYCRSPELFSPDPFSADHIVPRSKGGETSEENLAFCCQGCNGHKFTATAATDPVTGAAAPLFHPRRDRWGDHFVWSADFTRIVGLSPAGRATVERLRLNRPGLVNLRTALLAAERHPPDSHDEGDSDPIDTGAVEGR